MFSMKMGADKPKADWPLPTPRIGMIGFGSLDKGFFGRALTFSGLASEDALSAAPAIWVTSKLNAIRTNEVQEILRDSHSKKGLKMLIQALPSRCRIPVTAPMIPVAFGGAVQHPLYRKARQTPVKIR
ncbi:MAG: hypothetical protein WA672_20805 [Candidatus Angelobacter sp.]